MNIKCEYLNLKGSLLYAIIIIDLLGCNAFKKDLKYNALIEPLAEMIKSSEQVKS